MFRSLIQAYYLRQSQKRQPCSLEQTSSEHKSVFKASVALMETTLGAKRYSSNKAVCGAYYAFDSALKRSGMPCVNDARFGKYETAHNPVFKRLLVFGFMASFFIWFAIESYQGLTLF